MAKKRPDAWGLAGRVAVITGATRGIGKETADAFGRAGAKLVLVSRKEAQAQRVAAALAKRHRTEALGIEADVTDPKSVAALFRTVKAWTRAPIEVLANVAGHPIEPRLWDTPLHRLTPDEVVEGYARVYDADLRGARLCTYHALKAMVPARSGSIVYVSSTPALVGYKGGPYTEAKAGLLGLMRDVARAYGPKGIRANAIAPGNIRTDWLAQLGKSEASALERESPLRRFGEPREVADLILFLASQRSSFITGQTVVIDGGTVSH